MYVIRRAKSDDVPTLLKLARMVHFINLPADKEIIDGKVTWSRNCFLMAADADTHQHKPAVRKGAKAAPPIAHGELASGLKDLSGRTPAFLFVMEDTETSGVIGTSQIISRMGGPGAPNVSLQLSRKEMFSQSLQTGVTHTTARIHLDESSPTEIGGLILQPSFRGHKKKLGRFLAIVRFHFMGLHRELFSDRVLAEMMGPISIDGHNPFWDHCTRCFINLSYDEADRFCQQTKEFLLTLFPREELFLTLLPPEARAVVGTVGPETLPAKRMLEQLGFRHYNRVDPFDAGPHLEASAGDIPIVRDTDCARLGEAVPTTDSGRLTTHGIVSVLSEDGEFRAVETEFLIDRAGRLVIDQAHMAALQAEPGIEAGFTPLSKAVHPAATESARTPSARAASGASNGTQAAARSARRRTRS